MFICPDCGCEWDANDYACVHCGMNEDDLIGAETAYDEHLEALLEWEEEWHGY